MRKMSSLILGLSLAGSLLGGGVAAADEYGRPDRDRVEVRDHRFERTDRVYNRLPREAPPVAPVEHVVRRRGYDWQQGEYQWNGGRYEFVAGRYIARHRGYHWVAAHWEREGRVFVKIPGHWSRA
jgi:WXXGXW repeat (2 copies)